MQSRAHSQLTAHRLLNSTQCSYIAWAHMSMHTCPLCLLIWGLCTHTLLRKSLFSHHHTASHIYNIICTQVCSHIHMYTHIYITCAHMCRHISHTQLTYAQSAPVLTCTPTYTNTFSRACSHVHIHVHMYSYPCSHVHTCVLICTNIHDHTYMCSCVLIPQSCVHTVLTCIHICTHVCLHVLTCLLTHEHIHSHVRYMCQTQVAHVLA